MKHRNNNIDNLSSLATENLYTKYHSLLIQSGSIKNLTKKLLTIVNKLGFSDFIFMRTDRYWLNNSNYGLLYSVPDELMRVYHDEKMYEYDLLIFYAKQNTQPLLTSTIYEYINSAPFEIELINRNRKIQQLNRQFSFFDHYMICMKAFNKQCNVQLITTCKHIPSDIFRTRINQYTPHLQSLCKAVDTVCTQKFYSSFINYKDNPAKISTRQLAVFSMLANSDLTITEVANKMNIKPITAHQHIAAARKTLGVATNIAAIKKLVMLECIRFI